MYFYAKLLAYWQWCGGVPKRSYRAGLENHAWRKPPAGSNPALSAKRPRYLLVTWAFCWARIEDVLGSYSERSEEVASVASVHPALSAKIMVSYFYE